MAHLLVNDVCRMHCPDDIFRVAELEFDRLSTINDDGVTVEERELSLRVAN
jgi:uncharacterized metal-binding protein